MATVNFSVPDEVKQAFGREFKGRNKSAVIAELMRQAVDESRLRRQRSLAIGDLLAMRLGAGSLSESDFRRIRREGRS